MKGRKKEKRKREREEGKEREAKAGREDREGRKKKEEKKKTMGYKLKRVMEIPAVKYIFVKLIKKYL